MNTRQLNSATADMTKWLADPHELGRVPYKMECVGDFDLHGLHYYIFKYKAYLFSPWRTGVSGGFEADGTEPCGHTFSNMQKYNAATAQRDCTAMIEMIRAYWMEQAEKLAQK